MENNQSRKKKLEWWKIGLYPSLLSFVYEKEVSEKKLSSLRKCIQQRAVSWEKKLGILQPGTVPWGLISCFFSCKMKDKEIKGNYYDGFPLSSLEAEEYLLVSSYPWVLNFLFSFTDS